MRPALCPRHPLGLGQSNSMGHGLRKKSHNGCLKSLRYCASRNHGCRAVGAFLHEGGELVDLGLWGNLQKGVVLLFHLLKPPGKNTNIPSSHRFPLKPTGENTKIFLSKWKFWLATIQPKTQGWKIWPQGKRVTLS